jgi:hypothetical protein
MQSCDIAPVYRYQAVMPVLTLQDCKSSQFFVEYHIVCVHLYWMAVASYLLKHFTTQIRDSFSFARFNLYGRCNTQQYIRQKFHTWLPLLGMQRRTGWSVSYNRILRMNLLPSFSGSNVHSTGREATTHIYLVSRLRMHRATPSTPKSL